MVTVIIIFALFGAILMVAGIWTENTFLSACGGIMFGIFLLLLAQHQDQRPPAIEVYRGNTTLMITYKDSVAIDSIVVWKDK